MIEGELQVPIHRYLGFSPESNGNSCQSLMSRIHGCKISIEYRIGCIDSKFAATTANRLRHYISLPLPDLNFKLAGNLSTSWVSDFGYPYFYSG